jgi:hypothetical protein
MKPRCILLTATIALCLSTAFGQQKTPGSELRSDFNDLTYHWVTKTSFEALAVGERTSGVYGYVLFESPELARELFTGGPAGLVKEIGKDAVLEAARAMLETPDVAAMKMAKGYFRRGMSSYRENYEIYKKVREGQTLTRKELNTFKENELSIGLMGPAAQMMRDIRTEKYDLEKPAKRASDEATKEALKQLAELEGLKDQLDAGMFAARVIEIVREAQSPLEEYEPYKRFKKKRDEVVSSLRKEPPPARTPQTIEEIKEYLARKDAASKPEDKLSPEEKRRAAATKALDDARSFARTRAREIAKQMEKFEKIIADFAGTEAATIAQHLFEDCVKRAGMNHEIARGLIDHATEQYDKIKDNKEAGEYEVRREITNLNDAERLLMKAAEAYQKVNNKKKLKENASMDDELEKMRLKYHFLRTQKWKERRKRR